MSGAPHRGYLFKELGVVLPTGLKGFNFVQKDVSSRQADSVVKCGLQWVLGTGSVPVSVFLVPV